MGTGDFDLQVGYRRPVEGDELDQLIGTVSSILDGTQEPHSARAAAVVVVGNSVRAFIYDYREECYENPTTPSRLSIGITIHLTGEDPRWRDNLDLAQFLYTELDRQNNLDVLLLHDDEELVAHNFEDSSLNEFREFRYW